CVRFTRQSFSSTPRLVGYHQLLRLPPPSERRPRHPRRFSRHALVSLRSFHHPCSFHPHLPLHRATLHQRRPYDPQSTRRCRRSAAAFGFRGTGLDETSLESK